MWEMDGDEGNPFGLSQGILPWLDLPNLQYPPNLPIKNRVTPYG
jgi:hypothetical protein